MRLCSVMRTDQSGALDYFLNRVEGKYIGCKAVLFNVPVHMERRQLKARWVNPTGLQVRLCDQYKLSTAYQAHQPESFEQ